jgi:hypothetical protein
LEKHAVYGATVESLGALELFRPKGRHVPIGEAMARILASAENADKSFTDAIANSQLDTSWLPFAAQTYNISPDIRDYIVSGVPVVTSDVPNRNLQGMPSEEILGYRPDLGRVTYRTFVGKPTYQDHNNQDYQQAKGINLDAIIVGVPGYDLLKIVVLSAFDRTKDKDLTRSILKKDRKFYSMGAWVHEFRCSVCGENVSRRSCYCFGQYGKGGVTPDGRLVYQVCHGIDYFENSSVADPADVTAVSDNVMVI